MVTVYRIQDADGRGPFKPGFSKRWVIERDDQENLMPWIIEMPNVLSLSSGWPLGCGCRTIDQLKRWFTRKEYRKLVSLGYRAVQISGVRVLGESATQCVFECQTRLSEAGAEIKLY